MSLAATSVHTEETSSRFQQAPPQERSYDQTQKTFGEELRQRYPNEWPATQDAYALWDDADGGHRVDTLESCRSEAWFAVNRITGAVRVISSACHLRWCPLCAEARAAFLATSVRSWYSSIKHPKLLTLTLKHSDAALGTQIDHLYNSFQKLRRSTFFRKKVSGGIWFFQIKWIKKTDGWHPHLHILIDSIWLPQAELSARWLKITGDSKIADIRACWSADSAVNHVARYASRPGTLSSVPTDHRLELLQALENRRIVGAFGSARGTALKPPKAEDHDDWRFFGSWFEVHHATLTNFECRCIILAWKTGITVKPDICMDLQEPFKSDQPWLKDGQGNDYYSHSIYEDPPNG